MKKINILPLLAGFMAVSPAAAQNSAYISKVYDFRPAPGQFTNSLPAWEEGDTEETMIAKVNDRLVNNNGEMISLGGYGGYVVFGFDHPVVNVSGEYDFQIYGNAFYSEANPSATTALGGSAEPGIVMVSRDDNGNGVPDDAWYELAGSEYYKTETVHGYEIKYFRPSADHVATPDNGNRSLIDTTYIRWKANDGTAGYVIKNSFHSQDYYPQWVTADSMVFRGTKLRDNAVDESGNGSYYVLYCFDWGYADNHPNTTDMSKFKIDWAVDDEGKAVALDRIDFIKVYTAVNQSAGWLGEVSTEIQNAVDLHPDAASAIMPLSFSGSAIDVYDVQGRCVAHGVEPSVAPSVLQPGTYIMQSGDRKWKTIIK